MNGRILVSAFAALISLILVPLAGFASAAPSIDTQPQSQTAVAGSNVGFSVTASGQGLSYQWYFNGSQLPDNLHSLGPTSATVVLVNITASDAGTYQCTVSNAHGVVTSSNATLTVIIPPAIVTQPTDQTVYDGESASFSVGATGTAPLHYQWQFNGADVANATNSIFTFATTANAAGSYSVVVTNLGGSIQSTNAILTVLESAPLIVTQPANQFPNAASDASFAVTAKGSQPLSYQWTYNGSPLPDATNSVLQLPGVASAQDGTYAVVITNSLGSATSSNATLTVRTIVAWGDNRADSCSPPEDILSNVVAIAGEYYAGMGLRADGQVVEWVGGFILYPWPGIVSISSGGQHTLGVTTNGGIRAWGSNNHGESLPTPVTNNVVEVSGGANHSVLLQNDGTVLGWGDNTVGQTNVPAGLSNVIAIASGDSHNLALRSDGTVVGWGVDTFGQIDIPAGLSNVIAISCGVGHSMALKADGTVAVWGDNSEGQTNVPAGLSNVVAIAGGYNHCFVLKADGTTTAWGGDEYGAIEVPAGLTNVMAISAGQAYRCSTIVGHQQPAIVQFPLSADVIVGQTFVFGSSALGTVPLQYQWHFDGTNLPNATSPTLLLTNIGFANAGAYSITVTNALGGVESATAYLNVLPLKIVSAPSGGTVPQGTNWSFNVSVNSTQPVSYQWRYNGQNLSDATNATFSLTNVQTNSTGDYDVVVANSFGTVTSAVATLTVIAPPTFIVQPSSQSVVAGNPTAVSFTATANSDAPVTYRWYFNNVPVSDTTRISGSQTSSLSITNVQGSDAGSYMLVAANMAGTTTSTVAVLTVFIPPAITQQPNNGRFVVGSSFLLSAGATGNPTPAYQWWFNGVPLANGGRISGADSNTLMIANSQSNDSGSYWMTAVNDYGSATSVVALVSVQPAVTITNQPTNKTLPIGSNAVFTVGATGFVIPNYLWFSNGVALANGGRVTGATSPALTISTVQTNDSASYYVLVTNAYGSLTSSIATLTVLTPAQITRQPMSQAVLLGSNVTFAVSATGSLLGYQWFFNGTPVADDARISGSGTPALTIANVQSSDAGGYTVTVTNVFSAATSRMASLAVLTNLSSSVRYVDVNNTNPLPPYLDWSTAATNIQDAVDAAVNGDLVLVTNGVYQTGGRIVYGASSNRVVVDKVVTLQSVNGPQSTSIVGGTSRCVYLTNGAMLSGFTLTNGTSRRQGDAVLDESGGGVWCEGGTAIISNCVIVKNLAVTYGGGAFRGTIVNTALLTNTASWGAGAASNSLTSCTLLGNLAGLNNINRGGGAYWCTLSNCVVVGNSCNSSGQGGGTYSSILNACTISNNVSLGGGGGVYLGVANNCLISSNRASSGSGGGSFGSTLNNCLVQKNLADFGGGAYEANLLNSTVVANAATSAGGALYTTPTHEVPSSATNCIIYYNTAPKITNFPSFIATSYCCSPDPTTNGVGNFTNAPLFVDLANGDFHLQSNSPCINAGNNTMVPFTTDFDGNPRIVGGTVDIGAYEFQSPSSTISYAWLANYGLPSDGSADFADSDGDGLNNFQEWIAGTDPTNSLSALTLVSATNDVSGNIITWQSVSGKNYLLQRATDLTTPSPFSTLQSNIVGQAGTTTYIDTTATNGGSFFYRVGLQ